MIIRQLAALHVLDISSESERGRKWILIGIGDNSWLERICCARKGVGMKEEWALGTIKNC